MPSYTAIALRALLSYFTLLLLTRIMGKREISQMTYFDYVVGITIGSITANVMLDLSDPWTNLLPALLVFGLLQIASAYLSLKSFSFRKVVEGSSTILIKNGKILERNLLKQRISISELTLKLREKNAFKLADVEYALLEPDGKISVLLKSDKQPVTPSDLKFQTQYTGLPRIVIESGNIMGESLGDMGLTRSWLLSKLGEQGINDISRVMTAQVDTSGNLYVDLYDDFEQNTPQTKS